MRSSTVNENNGHCPAKVELTLPSGIDSFRAGSVPCMSVPAAIRIPNGWTAAFIREGTKSAEMLGLYGRCFSVVELNYTWYQMARADALARMVEKAPAHLLFAAKLTRTMTHERADNWREQLQLYRQGIAPLQKRLVADPDPVAAGF